MTTDAELKLPDSVDAVIELLAAENYICDRRLATALEEKLAANWSAAALQGARVSAEGLNSDLHGSADYRAALIPVLAARAVG